MKNSYKFKCKICGNSMVKAGNPPQGKQRYKCSNCNTRNIIKNESKTKQNELKLFAKWITDSTKVIDKVTLSRSTFYRKTKWCWGVIPKIKSEGIPSDLIFIDATYIGNEICLLIVRNKKHVLGFKWAKSETYEDYLELLESLH
jgi:DNA-directed RNA polymerase subunit RPC12/RpoP